jgi:hypothetical protein
MPCTQKRAKLLLARGRARVHRPLPFVTRLIDRRAEDGAFQMVRVKLDPGSKTTGIALVREIAESTDVAVLSLVCATVRPGSITGATKKEGWLAPSLAHRVQTTMSWVGKLSRYAPVGAISTELVRFDMQLTQNPELRGVEYQQSSLFGYEIREYLVGEIQ